LDPPAFGGSSIMSSGSISFALPFKIVVSRLLISLTCNVRASIDNWQEYLMFTISTHNNNIKTCRFGHHLLLRLPEPVFLFFLSSLSSSSSDGVRARFLSDERSTRSTR